MPHSPNSLLPQNVEPHNTAAHIGELATGALRPEIEISPRLDGPIGQLGVHNIGGDTVVDRQAEGYPEVPSSIDLADTPTVTSSKERDHASTGAELLPTSEAITAVNDEANERLLQNREFNERLTSTGNLSNRTLGREPATHRGPYSPVYDFSEALRGREPSGQHRVLQVNSTPGKHARPSAATMRKTTGN